MVSKKKEKNLLDEQIKNQIFSLYQKLRLEKKKEWNRVLPLSELLIDRWDKAKFLKAGKGTSVYDSSFIFGNVKIGKNTWVGPFTILDGSGGKLSIGDYCSISSGVQIYTHNSVNWAITGGKVKYDRDSVMISNCCYLGPYSVVTMGTKIGKCSIIGAHSFVSSTIPPFSIAFGVPAKIMGKVKIKGKKVSYDFFGK